MSPKGPLELKVNIKVKDHTKMMDTIERLQKKNNEFYNRIDQIQASTLHAQLARVGIKYSVSACAWQFLDVGQERDLGALLYKLFDYEQTTGLIYDHHKTKGDIKEFREWAHEQAIHELDRRTEVPDSDNPKDVRHNLDPISDQKELPDYEAPTDPEKPESDYPNV